ncbi:hypothetical protein EDB83DRAFT_2677659 [Lactarius deliciosus]|nr:hypothetical protein EDB83DRAFT_2677659 [Lactarius deliciosus]
MSLPPLAENGSAAADLAWYMHPSTSWDTDCGLPAHWARFRPCPEPMSAAALRRAAQTYGAAVAAFAAHAEARRRPVARGECWDIAHEALLHAAIPCAHDAPILSTSRAHGHLFFCGGDDCLRAGDIVEWRSIRIGGAQFGAFAVLGDPDHTAVLVEDTVSHCAVTDGDGVRQADVGVLTVVEQTAGRAPRRDSYDLAKLLEGEVWVYRPVGMVEYLVSMLSIDILETHAL